MSSLLVDLCTIDNITPHSNADKLEIAHVKGWQVITQKGMKKIGDQVIYVPPDSNIPLMLARALGVEKYLHFYGHNETGGRVRAIKLRGEYSFGLVFNPKDVPEFTKDVVLTVGENYAEHYGITKWEPKINATGGTSKHAPDHPCFHKYTDIENINNYPSIIPEGEEVVFTEKLHGSNSRVGLVRTDEGFKLMAGSHRVQRQEPADWNECRYWWPLTKLHEALEALTRAHDDSVIFYGELYGPGVQKTTYGATELSYRFFDVMIGSKYADYSYKKEIAETFHLDMVPLLYKGPFSLDVAREYAKGDTTLCSKEENTSSFKGREGIVITPTIEQYNRRVGRVILKCINPEYTIWADGDEESAGH